MPRKAGPPEGYVEVPDRILRFKAEYPDGSLQGEWSFHEADGKTYLVYVARAYRNPDDIRPGVGMAWEQVPGRTPYTQGSELMNAETSAWGRAIVALGFLANNEKIASAQEVRAAWQDKSAAPPPPPPTPNLPSPETKGGSKASSDTQLATQGEGQVVGPEGARSAQGAAESKSDGISPTQVQELRDLAKLAGVDASTLQWQLVSIGVEKVDDIPGAIAALTLEQAKRLGDELGKLVEEKTK